MTLVLSLATPGFVVQVSDRLVTYVATGQTKNANANKMVLFCNRVAFGYTGRAEIDGVATDAWMARVLGEGPSQDLAAALQHLADRATTAVASLISRGANRAYCRLAFVGVGWTHRAGDAGFLPIVCRVSNFHREAASGLPQPLDRFSVRYSIYDPPRSPPWGWLETGADLLAKEIAALHRIMKRCATRGVGPGAVIRLFADGIRTVARRNSTVGAHLMAAMIPRSAAGADSMLLTSGDGSFGVFIGSGAGGPPVSLRSREAVQFLYLPAHGRNVQYGPTAVCPGMRTIANPTMVRGARPPGQGTS